MSSYWTVEDGDGVASGSGMTERTARESALKRANATGKPWYIYETIDGEDGESIEIGPAAEYRAYDTVTEWRGPVRKTEEQAQADADRHNAGCADQGGYGSAIVVTRDPESLSRCVDLYGETVWPPHGRSCGSVSWA